MRYINYVSYMFQQMKKAECIMFPDLHGRDFWKKALANSCE